jgi:hypothetical protein
MWGMSRKIANIKGRKESLQNRSSEALECRCEFMDSGEHAWLRESTHGFGRTQVHKILGKSERV